MRPVDTEKGFFRYHACNGTTQGGRSGPDDFKSRGDKYTNSAETRSSHQPILVLATGPRNFSYVFVEVDRGCPVVVGTWDYRSKLIYVYLLSIRTAQ